MKNDIHFVDSRYPSVPDLRKKAQAKIPKFAFEYLDGGCNDEVNLKRNTDYLKLSKYFIVLLSLISFAIASRGFDILYLFLLADLFCCAFVFTVFYSFYNKVNEKTAYISIIIGLVAGLLMFPFPDFSKSLLVGVFLPKEYFSPFVAQSLLFLSFLVATFLPAIILKLKKN